jgi:hypothetical protein
LKNCCYYFLEYFMTNFVSLKRIGFILNNACFQSLTPKRLQTLDKLGFTITKIIVFNVQKWYGRYYFVVFEKCCDGFVDYLEEYFWVEGVFILSILKRNDGVCEYERFFNSCLTFFMFFTYFYFKNVKNWFYFFDYRV